MEKREIFLNTCVGPNCPEKNEATLEQNGEQIKKPLHGCSEYVDGKLVNKKICKECDHINSSDCSKDKSTTKISDGYCKPCAKEKEAEIEKFFAAKSTKKSNE